MKESGFMCYKFYDRLLLSRVSFMQLQIVNHSQIGISSSNRGRLLVLSQDKWFDEAMQDNLSKPKQANGSVF